nr:hypothetical protein GCM10020093_044930 [Planobispora longispora]
MLVSVVRSTVRGEIGAVTSEGRMIRVQVVDLPTLPPATGLPSLSGGHPISEYVTLNPGETVVGIGSLDPDGPGLALGTAQGVVKRVVPDYPPNRDEFEVIGLKDGDTVVGAVELTSEDHDLVFITSDAQLLRYSASVVRPQGRPAGGMAGVRLDDSARVIWFGAVDPALESRVVTIAGSSTALPGTQIGGAKISDYAEYPPKGRATGGVRAQRFLKGEDVLLLAWAAPARPAPSRPPASRSRSRMSSAAATAPASASPTPWPRWAAPWERPSTCPPASPGPPGRARNSGGRRPPPGPPHRSSP